MNQSTRYKDSFQSIFISVERFLHSFFLLLLVVFLLSFKMYAVSWWHPAFEYVWEIYLSALRSSTISTCDVIDDWWLIVRAPPAVRLPGMKRKKMFELEIRGISIENHSDSSKSNLFNCENVFFQLKFNKMNLNWLKIELKINSLCTLLVLFLAFPSSFPTIIENVD